MAEDALQRHLASGGRSVFSGVDGTRRLMMTMEIVVGFRVSFPEYLFCAV